MNSNVPQLPANFKSLGSIFSFAIWNISKTEKFRNVEKTDQMIPGTTHLATFENQKISNKKREIKKMVNYENVTLNWNENFRSKKKN